MEVIEWERWAVREQGREGWIKAGGALLISAIAATFAWLSLPPTAAAILIFLLLITVLPYFLPRSYRVSPDAVVVTRSFLADRREWREFRAFQRLEQGFLLLPAADKPSRFNLFLPLPLEAAKAQLLETTLNAKLLVV